MTERTKNTERVTERLIHQIKQRTLQKEQNQQQTTSPTASKKKRLTDNTAFKYMGMAFQMAIVIGIGVFIGRQLDDRFQTEKSYFTMLFALIFLFIAFYTSLKDLIVNPDSKK